MGNEAKNGMRGAGIDKGGGTATEKGGGGGATRRGEAEGRTRRAGHGKDGREHGEEEAEAAQGRGRGRRVEFTQRCTGGDAKMRARLRRGREAHGG